MPLIVEGYARHDNITDETLNAHREHYGDAEITKEHIFFYIYALLHHPTYRDTYAADLKKLLPHIPKVADFTTYSQIGRELAELHVNYEQVEPYPSVEEEWLLDTPLDEWTRYRITKPVWASRSKTDRTALIYNDYLTLTGIPNEAQNYIVNGRSPLDWVVDRYKVRTHKESQITNDPNDYCREIDNPRYIVDLIKSLVTVSMRTQELLTLLPEFVVEE